MEHNRKINRNPIMILKSQKGVALLIALLAVTLMTFIAVEVSYDTTVDYVVASQQVNRIKAFYAAKSGVEVSLLRIMLYKQVMTAMGDSLGENKSMLDPIWSFPFMWPPTAAGVEGMMETDKDLMADAVAEALMQAQYSTSISPEGGRLDINDLGSEIVSLKKSTKEQVLRIFQSEVQQNEVFRKKYSNYRFEDLVNNISDYIDEDVEGSNGGDETSKYRDLEDKDIKMPPNRPLRTLDELHQVAEMNDDFYNLLAPRVTIFGTKGININYAPKELLMAVDTTMTDEAADKVIARRNDPKIGGPFKDDKDFFDFVGQFGVNTQAIQDSKIPLLYDMEFNFRIISTGLSGNVKREITAITYDFANLKTRLAQLLDQADIDEGRVQQTGNVNTPAKKAKIEGTKGRPNVVYWEEN